MHLTPLCLVLLLIASTALAVENSWVHPTTPDCQDTSGRHLNYNASTNTFSCGTSSSGGTPGDAAADGTTKGIATFTAADFNATAGVISLDYTNAQKATGSVPGFLASADWTTFNNKVGTARAINTTSPLGGGGDLSADRTLTCSTCTTNAAALTANLPMIGGGGQAAAVGTRSGNTTAFATVTGTLTSGNLVKWDASGNAVDSGISAAGATGDITDVGSCSTGACFTSGSPSANLTFNNATSGTVTLQTVTGALGTVTVSLPAATTTLVGKDTTDTLTNKSIAATQLTGTLQAGQFPALTGDVTTSAGSLTTTLANIPTGTTGAGYVAFTAIAAPTTPGAGVARFYVDSTSKNLAVKDDAGVIKHGMQTFTCSNQVATAGSDAGAVTCTTLTSAYLPGSFNGFANPTGTLGLTAVNGSATTAMRSDAAPALSQSIAPTWTGLHKHDQNGNGTTVTDAILIENTTAAAAGAQQYSPSLHWSGQGWKTNATAATQAVDFRAYVLPTQGAANPTGSLTFESSINGGAYGNPIVLSSAGGLSVGAQVESAAGVVNANTGFKIANGAATAGRYLKGDGTNFVTSSGSASGTGSCANQAVTALNNDAAPTCTTLTGAYLNNAITLGTNASSTGQLGLANGGGSGATVTLQNNGATSAYNFNLPTTAGSANQVLTSQAGGSTAMTWTTLATSATTDTTNAANISSGNLAFARNTAFVQAAAVGFAMAHGGGI